jgi:hypothetical protein
VFEHHLDEHKYTEVFMFYEGSPIVNGRLGSVFTVLPYFLAIRLFRRFLATDLVR